MKRCTEMLLVLSLVMVSGSVQAVEHFRLTNDTVIDRFTGLEWQRALTDGEGKNHDNAQIHCSELSLGGHKDWRLPMVKELSTPVDVSTYNPAINGAAFPHTPSSRFLSKSLCVGIADRAWVVNFELGDVFIADTADVNRVRCAR
jgi:hypothetical protein